MRVDAITLEVFNHRLSAIAEEMGVTLCRSAFSPNIKERRDFSCAVFDSARRHGCAGGTHSGPPRLDAALGARGDRPRADEARRRGHPQRPVCRRHPSTRRDGGRAGVSTWRARTVRVRRQSGAPRRHRWRQPRLDAVGDGDLPGRVPPAAGAHRRPRQAGRRCPRPLSRQHARRRRAARRSAGAARRAALGSTTAARAGAAQRPRVDAAHNGARCKTTPPA